MIEFNSWELHAIVGNMYALGNRCNRWAVNPTVGNFMRPLGKGMCSSIVGWLVNGVRMQPHGRGQRAATPQAQRGGGPIKTNNVTACNANRTLFGRTFTRFTKRQRKLNTEMCSLPQRHKLN